MFCWTEEMVGYMKDACAYGDYHRRLAASLAPQLQPQWHVCDAGCGLGALSLALSPYAARVTAADVSALALAALPKACRERGVTNVEPLCGDIRALAPAQPYDAMVFCFFGQLGETLSIVARQCRGPAFLIKKNYSTHRFSVGEHPVTGGYAETMRVLQSRGIPFAPQTLTLEFGQPLRSMADARRFFALYSRDADKGCITDEFLSEKLVKTGRDDFPLYLPQERRLGILRVEGDDVRRAETGADFM